MLRFTILICLGLLPRLCFAQQPVSFSIQRDAVVNVSELPPDFHLRVQHMEAPSPDGHSAQSFLMNQKRALASRLLLAEVFQLTVFFRMAAR
jgi:hypothetical protein